MFKKLFLVVLVSCLLLFSMPFTDNVKAIPITLETWESYNVGATFGTGALIDWENHQDNNPTYNSTVELVDYYGTGSNSLWFRNNGESDDIYTYLNFTDGDTYASLISLDLALIVHGIAGGSAKYIYFCKDDVIILGIEFSTSLANEYVKFQAHNGSWMTLAPTGWHNDDDDYELWRLDLTHTGTNHIWYRLFSATEGKEFNFNSTAYNGETSDNFTGIDQIILRHDDGAGGNNVMYIDDIRINTDPPEGQESSGEGDLYFNFFYQPTGVQLRFVGVDLWGSIPPTWNIIQPVFESDLWLGDYDSEANTMTLTVTADFVEGSLHTFSLHGVYFDSFEGFVDTDAITFSRIDLSFTVYNGQTFNIFISDTSEAEVYSQCASEIHCDKVVTVCTDSDSYTKGEQVRIKYNIPSQRELHDCGLASDGWKLIVKHGWMDFWAYGWGDFTGEEYYTTDITVYGTENEINIDSNDLFMHGGVNSYRIYIGIQGGWPGMNSYLFDTEFNFLVTNGTFTPSGSITSVSPTEPFIGQKVTFAWTANNNGKIMYRNLLYPEEPENIISDFEKPLGTAFANHTFYKYGTYLITLYIWNGEELDSQDNSLVFVNATGENFSGYNAEFCEILRYRLIAGYDSCNIVYQSFNASTLFRIMSPRGEVTSYSQLRVGGQGTLTFFIQPDSPIGTYNVTMYGNETFYTSFNVVASEGNWIEFTKNVYYDNEAFGLYIRHDKTVSLTFYKNDIAQGKTLFMEENEHVAGEISINPDTITPTSGEWRVEMWEINNRARIRELAQWDCIVVTYVQGLDIGVADPLTGNLPYLIDQAFDSTTQVILGLFITLMVTLVPFLAILKLKKDSNVNVNIPNILYGVCFCVSTVICFILGLFPFEIMFFLCFMVIAIFGMLWLSKRPSAPSEA